MHHIYSIISTCLITFSFSSLFFHLSSSLPPTIKNEEIVKDPKGDATTTLYLDATESRKGKYPEGIITSSIDKFIDSGTTTEYMTQHVGTYIDGSNYAKIESTSTREYYRIPIEPTSVQPTGLIASSISYEVNNPGMTTEHTVHQYRTYVDGHYAHLVSSISNVYYDPPVVSATPVYKPVGEYFEEGDDRRAPKDLRIFPREHIRPARPLNEGVITRSIGTRTFGAPKFSKALRLDDLIEAESKRKHFQKFKGLKFDDDDERLNLIRARSIQSGDFKAPEQEEEEKKEVVPTFTVNEDGLLNIPTPSIEAAAIHENEIEPTSVPHRFEKPVKPSRTSLDSVTYVGFVDFTTTIDDTVVIFRPKKTFRTATRNIILPKIVPSRSSFFDRDPLPSSVPSSSVDTIKFGLPDLDSSQPEEEHRTTKPEKSTPLVKIPAANIPKHTSGINPLKKLLASSSRRKFAFRPQASIHPSKSAQSTKSNRPIITLNPNFRPGQSSAPSIDSSKDRSKPSDNNVPEINELDSSINTDSDVELVYKTLYTTYTYFTTFFRASTTRVKSRAEVISNVITLTNILSPDDLHSLRSSCQVDKTCQFASSSLAASNAFTASKGFGRPNTKPAEQVRSNGNRFITSGKNDKENELDSGVLRTYYTTYTYFTTLQLQGTTSISTRTEVYSNIKSSGVPVSGLPKNSLIRPSSSRKVPEIKATTAPAIEKLAQNKNRLQYSSISRDSTTTEKEEVNTIARDRLRYASISRDTTTTTEKDTTSIEETTSTEANDDEETTTEPYVVLGVTSETTESTVEATTKIEPTTADSEDITTFNEETPALTDTTIENDEAESVDPTSPTPALKTFYTTYTYFTTLFRNGSSFITSNLETVTNTADATIVPSVVQPSVTFFTTFTYWTTSIDGDKTIITSQEETKTDILPASLTEQISLLPTSLASIEFTNTLKEDNEIVPTSTKAFENRVAATIAPELESGEVSSTSVENQDEPLASSTPTLASSSIISIEDLDTEFVLSTTLKPSESSSSFASQSSFRGSSRNSASRSSSTFTKPSRTFTPVIRPNLFNPTRRRPNTRRRSSTLTTVAIITRSDITPTLIATPASVAPSSPVFGSSSSGSSSASVSGGRAGSRFSSSRASINPTRSSSTRAPGLNPTATSQDGFEPSIVTNLRLRRPSPFRARLKERQKQRLQQLRSKSRGQNTDKATEKPKGLSITPPKFPAGLPGRTPIFVSSKTETFSRRPKEVESKDANNELEEDNTEDGNIRVPSNIQTLRERARARINKLFRRRRPNFSRPRPGSSDDKDPLVPQESRRRKRQVSNYYSSSYGTRTRARQTYAARPSVSRETNQRLQPQYFQSLNDPPFTAFSNYVYYDKPSYSEPEDLEKSASTKTPTPRDTRSSTSNIYSTNSDYDDTSLYSSSSGSSSSRRPKSTATSRSRSRSTYRKSSKSNNRPVRQNSQASPTRSRSRSRSRFNPSRSRLRSRPKSTQRTTTTTPRPLRTRFRPRKTPSSIRQSSQSSFNSFSDYDDYYDDYDYDVELQSSQKSVPTEITVTHAVPVRTVIPIRENGVDTFREILTTSPSLEVIAATQLKSTNIGGTPVIYANTETNAGSPGTKIITFEALRATETTSIKFTPTRIRGLRTTFSKIVPSTIYNIKPVTTSIVEPVDNNELLTQLLLQLLAGKKDGDSLPAALAPALTPKPQIQQPTPQLNPILPNLGINPSPQQTQFVTHTSTYVTTITNTQSTVLPITFRGREIKTTLVETNTEVVTATELSTQTIAPTAAAAPVFATANPIGGLLGADLQQQLLAAQLQQQLQQQQVFYLIC